MTKRNMGFTYIAELHLGIGGANPWTPPTAISLNPGVGPMLTGNYCLETGLGWENKEKMAQVSYLRRLP